MAIVALKSISLRQVSYAPGAAVDTSKFTQSELEKAYREGSLIDSSLLSPGGGFIPGWWYMCSGQRDSGNLVIPNGSLRVTPWYVPQQVTLVNVGCGITTGGEVGSLLRIGIYKDNGQGYPGNLVLDSGTAAGQPAAVLSIPCSVTVEAGLHWVGTVAQNVVTTAPALRAVAIVNTAVQIGSPNTLASATETRSGYTVSGITGALPATFPTPPSAITAVSTAAVVHFQVAS